MPVPTTTEELIGCVRQSGLLEAVRLDEYVNGLSAQSAIPPKPRGMAQALLRDGLLTKYQAEQILLGRWRNFALANKYKVLERLGSGGMANVFLCEHLIMKRLVALKVLPPNQASKPDQLARFHREARAVAALRHPNIVEAYDIDRADGMHFLVTEFVDGPDLERIVQKNGPLSPERAAHYIAQAALGLQHAHESGMVHRDIKPGNLLVDRSGTVKILDLGLARTFEGGDHNLTKGHDFRLVLGTIDYLAPEQAADSHGVDTRADIYGLGCTFYFLLTGQPLFPEGTVAQKVSWHQLRKPRPISDFRDDVPASMIAVLERMLAKAPADRYQEPWEVAEALEEWTREPIEPPSEDELPALSPAARAAGSSLSITIKTPTPSPSLSTTSRASTVSRQRTQTPTPVPASPDLGLSSRRAPTLEPQGESASDIVRQAVRPSRHRRRRQTWVAALIALTAVAGLGVMGWHVLAASVLP